MNKDKTNVKDNKTNDDTVSNKFKAPPVGSYIPKKTPQEVHDDLLASYGYTDNKNTGHQK
jgi:hypothetical protein